MERFNDAAMASFGKAMGNKWVGSFVRTRFLLDTMKTRGIYVVPQCERPKIDALARRYGLDQTSDVSTN
jgi:hypothetical protein